MTASLPSASVHAVIVTYNGAPWIEGCLDTLLASAVPVRVIVVDNASSDATPALVRQRPEVTWIESGSNLGFGRACNLGAARALADGADWVLLLNQDARWSPDALTHLLAAAAEHPDAGILAPLQMNEGAQLLDAITVRRYLSGPGLALLSAGATGAPLPRTLVLPQWPAAAWLVSKRCWQTVGGFDPLFFMYGEDDDYANRLTLHGLQTVLVPAARFEHFNGFHADERRLPWRTQVRKRRNRLYASMVVHLKRPGGAWSKRLWQRGVQWQALALGELLAHGDTMEWCATQLAMWDVLRALPRIVRHRRLQSMAGPHWLSG